MLNSSQEGQTAEKEPIRCHLMGLGILRPKLDINKDMEQVKSTLQAL